ncbi:MAG: hypothetical protein ACFFEW_01685 [Candidatus Thorarchaeota archaeon]
MNHRLKNLVVVVLTFVITLSGGLLTEYARQSMVFSWAINVGNEFVYDVTVIGNRTTTSQVLPPPFEPMNNTRIIVEITSLPNLTLMYYSFIFVQEVVNFLKTSSQFENRSPIPPELYNTINSHVSMSMLPIGAWGHLDSLFPDQTNIELSDHESFISRYDNGVFFFGHWENQTGPRPEVNEWHGIYDVETGVPSLITISVISRGALVSDIYTITMTLVSQ